MAFYFHKKIIMLSCFFLISRCGVSVIPEISPQVPLCYLAELHTTKRSSQRGHRFSPKSILFTLLIGQQYQLVLSETVLRGGGWICHKAMSGRLQCSWPFSSCIVVLGQQNCLENEYMWARGRLLPSEASGDGCFRFVAEKCICTAVINLTMIMMMIMRRRSVRETQDLVLTMKVFVYFS